MDFLDPAKKRAHLIRLYVGYVLIGLIIAVGSVLLLLQSYGYGVDRKTGEIIQNGIVFVSAQPEAADIYLNNKLYKNRDSARLVLPAGQYKLELKRDGYRTWQRSFDLAGGSLERLVYPFLFPEKLDTTEQHAYTGVPGLATETPDRHWIVIQKPGQLAAFDVWDTGDPKKPATTFTLPPALLTVSDKHTLKLVEWSTDNRRMLVEHQFTGGHEFVVIDREVPAESVNINKVFKRVPTQVTLRDKRFDRLYLYDQATQRLEFGTLKDAVVRPVQSSVLAYKSHGDDMLIYATQHAAAAGKANIVVQEGDNVYRLREVTADARYFLDVARFDNRWYMVAGSAVEQKVYVYKDPLPILKHQTQVPLIPATVLRVDAPDAVAFSSNARFVMAQGSGSKFAVYDAETERSTRYDTKTLPDPGEQAHWMDGHRLMVISAGKLVVFDYDGTNLQTLTPSLPGFVPFFDRNYERLYNLAPSPTPNATSLTRTNLKLVPTGQ